MASFNRSHNSWQDLKILQSKEEKHWQPTQSPADAETQESSELAHSGHTHYLEIPHLLVALNAIYIL